MWLMALCYDVTIGILTMSEHLAVLIEGKVLHLML